MKRISFIITIIFLQIILFQSCSIFNSKLKTSKKFQIEFNINKSEYIKIKDFFVNNSDSIFSIISKSDTSCFISKKKSINDLGIFNKFNIQDSVSIKNISDRELLKSIHRFMIEQNISQIVFIDNSLSFCYFYSKIPCFKLIWNKNESTEKINEIIKVKGDDFFYWKYNIDKNWCIKGIPCFN
ncbi:MAG: hypothetical protein H6Q25_1323 [Bacteroidetes bacterium]|nr:hypothetical protein [Bacteroidota bacterium]